jgi:hypothetical protein
MATIMMAMDHFNARNPLVVSQFATDPMYRDCPIQFDYDMFEVFDTGTFTHGAIQGLVQSGNTNPCVVIGPFHDVPALELSTLAAAYEFPVLAHRAFNLRVTAEYASPYTTQLFPDMTNSVHTFITVLTEQLNRTDFVAILYALTDTGVRV